MKPSLKGRNDIVLVQFGDSEPFVAKSYGWKGLDHNYINVNVLLTDTYKEGDCFTISVYDCRELTCTEDDLKMLGSFEAFKQAYPEYFL